QVTLDERIALANKLVGAPLESAEQAAETLLASEDPWLRSCGIYAVGALQIQGLERDVRRLESASDPVVREAAQAALQRFAPAPEVPGHPSLSSTMSIRAGSDESVACAAGR